MKIESAVDSRQSTVDCFFRWKIFVLLFLFFYAGIVTAQRKYASNNAKAIKAFENALKCLDGKYYSKAFDYLDDAIKEDPTFVDVLILRANIFEEQQKYNEAIDAFKQSFHLNPDYFPNSYYTIGKIEFRIAQYDSAKVHFEKFLSYKDIRPELSVKSNQLLMNAQFASDAIKHPIPFNPVNMGDSINTDGMERLPAITADGSTFIFTRAVKAKDFRGREVFTSDFYVSHFKNGYWQQSQNLSELNTSGNEGAPSLSADGQYLFFAACEERIGGYAGNRKGEGRCDIFIAKKIGNKFQEPRNLGQPVNTGGWETQPSFSSDGRTLYFVREVKSKEGKSNTDIFITHIDDSSRWSDPVPLSDMINTSGNEESVFIHPDNQTLYFSSDGHPGMGGLDIFMSRRQPDGSWGEPINLGYPINTSNDENSLLVSPAGDIAYFASDRVGGKGGLDLYQFELYPAIRPEPITYMKGKVYDSNTKLPIVASFELIDLATAKPVMRSVSNSGNGEFLVCLPAGKSYALNVSKDGYLFYSDNFELKNPKNAKEPFLKDVPLHPIKAGESVVLKNIFYDTDQFNIKDESKAELGKLISFLNKNPKVKIEISGHTDNVGAKPHNQTLSENRAKAVYDYLVANKIPESRLSFKGFGDSKPIASNDKEEGRAQNRRTEFTIIAVN